MANGFPLSFFLNREQIEKLSLARQFIFGRLFGFEFLRVFRNRILRERAIQSTNCGVPHIDNGDEAKFEAQGFVGSFTKGLPHNDSGVVADSDQFRKFRLATHTGDFFNDCQPQLGKVADGSRNRNWRAVLSLSLIHI